MWRRRRRRRRCYRLPCSIIDRDSAFIRLHSEFRSLPADMCHLSASAFVGVAAAAVFFSFSLYGFLGHVRSRFSLIGLRLS